MGASAILQRKYDVISFEMAKKCELSLRMMFEWRLTKNATMKSKQDGKRR